MRGLVYKGLAGEEEQKREVGMLEEQNGERSM